jgi:hypothetical protein
MDNPLVKASELHESDTTKQQRIRLTQKGFVGEISSFYHLELPFGSGWIH